VQVYLVRHAEAVAETLSLRDRDRHLTVAGRAQARALGDRLRWHDCMLVQLWSSPLIRAVQTAELVAAGLACDLPVEALAALAPDENPRDVIAALTALAAARPDASVLVVGHEPGLSAVGALLVGEPGFASLGKAHAARIDDGVLRWRFAWDADAPEIPAR
jgi:phosphohistidine phosphatase